MKRNLIYLLVLVLVAGVAFYLSKKDTKGSSTEVFMDFAILDTAQVQRIYIGNLVTKEEIDLKRQADGTWSLNGEGRARADRVNTLLTTFDRAEVLAPVPKSELKNTNAKMSSNNKKIMIFGEDNKLLKIWYLSHAIQSQQGTYALLELPDKGKSAEPVILSISGFRGYLGSRFGTDVYDWKSTEVFRYPDLDLKEIDVFRPKELHNSFKIIIDDFVSQKFRLEDSEGRNLSFNPELLAQYIRGYKGIYIESFRNNMTNAQQDSLRALKPDFQISILDNRGNQKSVDLYYRPPTENHKFAGYENNPEQMAGIFQDDIVSFQIFNMGKLLAKPNEFQ